jgi:hypothetical protein
MSVGIITSAAYINPEMSAEFGPLPPAFLPVGNTRLFKYQTELLRKLADRVVLTLPESFVLSSYDEHLLEALGVDTIRIPDGLSLAESVMLAIIQSVDGDEPIVILHGDTLFLGLEEFPLDRISVHCRDHPYPWAVVSGREPLTIAPLEEDNRSDAAIVSGLFSFSHGLAFLKCLARARKEFLAALNAYARQCPEFSAIDDCGEWLDLGHLNTYYDSRRTLTTQRMFNTLSIARNTVSKTSAQRDKMDAEASWFEALPSSLMPFVPTYLGRIEPPSEHAGYRLAYEYLCPLSDLYVFGVLPAAIWRRILTCCADVLAQFRAAKPKAVEAAWFDHLYAGKSLERFSRFARDNGISPDEGWEINGRMLPSPQRVIAKMADIVGPPSHDDSGILHGDFCLSNILFDFRRNSVKLVDPRGYVRPNTPDVFGDTRYDIGKLHHSIVGRYDFIIAGYYELRRVGPNALFFEVASAAVQEEIERHFVEVICDGDHRRHRMAAAISVLLFFSMLPLHADDPRRQWALLANGYRLYQRYFGDRA